MEENGIRSELRNSGWCMFSPEDAELDGFLSSLGRVISKIEVSPISESRSLVKSIHQMPPHTDHYLAKYIVWHCIRQDPLNGSSVMVDGIQLYKSLPKETQEVLDRIRLKLSPKHMRISRLLLSEDSDPGPKLQEFHPMISKSDTDTRIFYQHWMVEGILDQQEKTAFQEYIAEVRNAKETRILLSPGECLVVDNGRMLHGRDSLSEDSNRLLIRYWVS